MSIGVGKPLAPCFWGTIVFVLFLCLHGWIHNKAFAVVSIEKVIGFAATSISDKDV